MPFHSLLEDRVSFYKLNITNMNQLCLVPLEMNVLLAQENRHLFLVFVVKVI